MDASATEKNLCFKFIFVSFFVITNYIDNGEGGSEKTSEPPFY